MGKMRPKERNKGHQPKVAPAKEHRIWEASALLTAFKILSLSTVSQSNVLGGFSKMLGKLALKVRRKKNGLISKGKL